jgi:hypothetical protein
VFDGLAHHRDNERGLQESGALLLDLIRCRLRIFLREQSCENIPGAGAGVTLEHDEAPGRELAVIGHAGADGENGVELGRRRAGAGHLHRL